MIPGIAHEDEPAHNLPGMTSMRLDDQSRLTYFEALPLQVQSADEKTKPVDWNVLFKMADLDPAQFQKAEPLWASPSASDERAAWTGTLPGTAYPLRVEAAAWLGKPVFFRLIGPWSTPAGSEMPSGGDKARILITMSMGILAFLIPGWLAWRNIARGKADRRGALRLGLVMFLSHLMLWILLSHFTASLGEFSLFVMALSTSLFSAALVWTMYLALEPYIRRHWPQTIISWSRLLNGQIRDPAVGRDALFGVVLGTLWVLIFVVRTLLTRAAGGGVDLNNTAFLEGARSTLGAWLGSAQSSVPGVLMFVFVLFILRVVLRNQWLAGIVFVAIFTATQVLGSAHPAIDIPAFVALYAIAAVALARFGLVTLAAAVFTADAIGDLTVTTNPSTWYFGSNVFVFASVVLLAGWAFHAATAGRKMFAGDWFE